jgi:DNA invertase Pin-like site-specific DNA recombinase
MSEIKGKQKEKPLRAVIYCRTSGDDSDLAKQRAREELKKLEAVNANGPNAKPAKMKDLVRKKAKEVQKISIEEQRKLCAERCEKLGFEIIGEPLVDNGLSGRTYPKGFELADPAFDDYFDAHIKKVSKRVRPALGDVFNLKNIDVIVVRDIYRLLRPAFQSHLQNHLWQLLTRRKIKIHSVSDGDIDTNKFEDLMITNLKLQIADQAKRQELAASIRSLHALKDDGKLASGVKCYGLQSRSGEAQTVDKIDDELKIVRIIYDKYLSGMTIFAIARYLNDDLKKLTREGFRWTVHAVRKVLLRPWYCGLQHNTDGELIESQVFPSGADATITKDEYYRVRASFDKRKQFTAPPTTDPETGKIIPGPKVGSRRENSLCHPFSGLMKCGICGKNLRISQVINKYYDGKVPVKQFYYICKTDHDTQAEEFKDCKRVRIKECYPQEALALVSAPSGYGLVECLFPLIFGGYINQFVAQVHGATELTDKQSYLNFELGEMAEYENRLLGQFESKAIDDEQFKMGMKRCREKKDGFKKQLLEVERGLARIYAEKVSVPQDLFDEHTKMPRETIQELAHATFEEILVYPDKITVVFKKIDPKTREGCRFDIHRHRSRNARDLPFWSARINHANLSKDTKIGVAYFYRSTLKGYYRKIDMPYHDGNLEVITLGINQSIDKKRAPIPLPALTWMDAWLKDKFGVMPGYKPTLKVNSTTFFSNMWADLDLAKMGE